MAVSSEQLLDVIKDAINKWGSSTTGLGDELDAIAKVIEIETTAALTREHWSQDHGVPDIFGGGPQGVVN